MATQPGLLVLGLDAASAPLVRAWAAEGFLPNLAALMARGQVADMRGIQGFFTGSTWPSLLTGTNPARHGIHYLAQLVPGTYGFGRPHEAEYIRAPMFWEALGRAGKRLAILDVPLAKPDRGIPGIQSVEWAGHDAIFGFQTTPSGLAAEVLAKHGHHPVLSDCDRIGRAPEDFRRFVDSLVRGVELKTRLTIDLLQREPWDLFLQVFTETHCAGHQCWHLHDPAHPNYDPAVFAGQDPVLRVYQAVDQAIGAILEAAGQPPVMIVLSHGMAHAIGVHRLLPGVLARLGLLVPGGDRPFGPRDLLRGIVRRLPGPARRSAEAWLRKPPPPGRFGLPTLGADPLKSRCFVVPNGLAVSGIRVNLAGREPRGTVKPVDVPHLFADLREALMQLREEATGRLLVRRVVRSADLYSGPNLGLLPDFLVEWNDEFSVASAALKAGPGSVIRATSPRTGTVEAVNGYQRTGEHRPDGMLIVAGPGIPPGRPDLKVSILDVAPTITAAMGVPLAGAEGRAVPELIPTGR